MALLVRSVGRRNSPERSWKSPMESKANTIGNSSFIQSSLNQILAAAFLKHLIAFSLCLF